MYPSRFSLDSALALLCLTFSVAQCCLPRGGQKTQQHGGLIHRQPLCGPDKYTGVLIRIQKTKLRAAYWGPVTDSVGNKRMTIAHLSNWEALAAGASQP
jgi:hypothetical protein